MTFVAADGENYETANSFSSVQFSDDYFSLRGNESWAAATSNQKETALIKATDYLEQVYGSRWVGTVYYRTVGLSWPRYSTVYDTDVIPENLQKAVCELALEALITDLNPIVTRERAVKREMVAGAIDTEYFETGTLPTLRPAVMGYLAPLLRGSTFNRPVVRA